MTGLETALSQARKAAGDGDVGIMGGADTIRQVLAAGHLDELVVTVAPVILGAGKRLSDGFTASVTLDQVDALPSPSATHLRYRIRRT